MIEIFTRSKPDRKNNDDIAGYAGNTFWLMDGATQLVAPEHGLDASWHVGALNKAFVQALQSSPRTSLVNLVQKAIREVAEEFMNASGLTENDPQELRPFSTLVLCRTHETKELEYFVISDSTLAIIGPDDEKEISDKRIDLTDPLASTDALLRQGHDFSSESFKKEMQNVYRQTFLRINKPTGFDVVGQDPSVVDRAITGRISLEKEDHILLMSDGFTRGKDTLGLYASWKNVVADLNKHGGEYVLQKIRESEEADRHGLRHPRSSVHDDATLLWIKPQINL